MIQFSITKCPELYKESFTSLGIVEMIKDMSKIPPEVITIISCSCVGSNGTKLSGLIQLSSCSSIAIQFRLNGIMRVVSVEK